MLEGINGTHDSSLMCFEVAVFSLIVGRHRGVLFIHIVKSEAVLKSFGYLASREFSDSRQYDIDKLYVKARCQKGREHLGLDAFYGLFIYLSKRLPKSLPDQKPIKRVPCADYDHDEARTEISALGYHFNCVDSLEVVMLFLVEEVLRRLEQLVVVN